MTTQNLIRTDKVYRRLAQRAFFVWSGYAIALLLVATLVDEFWALSLPILVIFAAIGVYAHRRHNTLDFPRALARPVLVWTLTAMVTIMLYQVSPWMTQNLAVPLIVLLFVSLFFGTASAVLSVQYDKQYPPATPEESLRQHLCKWTAIIGSVGYIAIYAILWLNANDLSVIYGRWFVLAMFAVVADLCLYEVPMLERLRKALFIVWFLILSWNVVLAIFAAIQIVPFNRELGIAWAVTFIASLAMMHAAFAGKVIDPNDRTNN